MADDQLKLRKSKIRDRIFEVLEGTGIHPNAEWVYLQLKNEIPRLSLGSVYRNLNVLCEQGRVKRVDFGNNHEHFEARVSPHYHFLCESCGAVMDLKTPIMHELDDRIARTVPHTIKSHEIRFFGICQKCKNERNQK